MAAGRNYPLSLILTAFDKASGPVQRIHANLKSLTEPTRAISNRFSALSRETKALGETAGIPRLVSGFRSVSSAIGDVEQAASRSFRRVGLLVAGGAGIAYLFKRQFVDTASTFENMEVSLEGIEGSAEKAQRAMGFIKRLTFETPFELEDIARSYRILRGFGLDPIANKTLPAIADQTAKLGLKGEDLAGVALQLGQAWSKGRLQAQDANILVERGVPVWGLLQRAVERVNSGQEVTVAQLRQMSEDGQLGQNAIRELINQMGLESEGASKRMMGTWTGMISNLSDHWTFFKLRVKETGAFEGLKSEVRDILVVIDRWAANGQLQLWANRIGGALRDGFGWLRANGPAILAQIGDHLGTVWGIANNVATAFGGWGNFITFGIAAYIGGPLVGSVVSLAAAIASLNLALVGTPAGLLLLVGAGVVAGAGYVLWKGMKLQAEGPGGGPVGRRPLVPVVPGPAVATAGQDLMAFGGAMSLGPSQATGGPPTSGGFLAADQVEKLRAALDANTRAREARSQLKVDVNAPPGTRVRLFEGSDPTIDLSRGFAMADAGAR